MARLLQINWIEYQALGLLGIGMVADIEYILQCRTRVWDNTVAPWSIFLIFFSIMLWSHASRLLAEMHKLPRHSHFCALCVVYAVMYAKC